MFKSCIESGNVNNVQQNNSEEFSQLQSMFSKINSMLKVENKNDTYQIISEIVQENKN